MFSHFFISPKSYPGATQANALRLLIEGNTFLSGDLQRVGTLNSRIYQELGDLKDEVSITGEKLDTQSRSNRQMIKECSINIKQLEMLQKVVIVIVVVIIFLICL